MSIRESATNERRVELRPDPAVTQANDKPPALRPVATLPDTPEPKAQGSRVWRRFVRHRLGPIGAVILFALAVTSIGAPWLAPHDPNYLDLSARELPPSLTHPLGTDLAGRDVLSRTIHGGRVSLAVALVAVSISTTIGTTLGMVSGFYGGRIDTVIGRVVDVLMAFPGLVLIITVASVLGPSLINTMLIIGLLSWTGLYRLVRAQIYSLRHQDFVIAAHALGVPDWMIIVRHLIPNTLAPVVVSAAFGIASAILTESGLSFLGLGVTPPTATWGTMLYDTQSLFYVENTPWIWIPPGLAIMFTVLSVNFLGDGLLKALNPAGDIA